MTVTEKAPPDTIAQQKLTRQDFVSDQEVRWCPGCGDYAILAQLQKILPDAGIRRENVVFVSGIGCSSRAPYYLDTYGFHSIHGRATAIATGMKCANPDLSVWVATGDGDGLSIGGNHMLHTLRRNMDIKVLLFNNRIYGLTKGQTSPTSEQGKRTKSTPYGSIENPINPVSFALAAEATFVARAIATETRHLADVLRRAAQHKGSAFIEIYQNCNIFNDGAFEDVTSRETKPDRLITLEHGKPLVFGRHNEKAIRIRQLDLEVGPAEGGSDDGSHVVVHNEKEDKPRLAYMLGGLTFPEFPTAIGVFRAVEKPSYANLLLDQIRQAREQDGPGTLHDLIYSGEPWTIG